MSIKLDGISCRFCDYPKMKLLEVPCCKPAEALGLKDDYFQYVKFADAECPACGAEYLAWCDGFTIRKGDPLSAFDDKDTVERVSTGTLLGYSGLSFRSTFCDEPGESDMPKRKARQVWVDAADKILAELPAKE